MPDNVTPTSTAIELAEAQNEIYHALYGLRRAFHKHNIPIPDVMAYRSAEDTINAFFAIEKLNGGGIRPYHSHTYHGPPFTEFYGFTFTQHNTTRET